MDNTLLILGDDLRVDVAYGFMPFLVQLRTEGTTFMNMRCPSPICSPSRAALSSGQYASGSANGVYLNEGATGDVTAPATNAIAPWLQAANVETAMFGKYTIPGTLTQTGGYDRWHVLPSGTQSAFGYTVRDGTGANITPAAPKPHQLLYLMSHLVPYLTSVAQPNFTWFSPTNPHIDANVTGGNNPIGTTRTRYQWLDWELDLLSDADMLTKPSFHQTRPKMNSGEIDAMRYYIRNQIREATDLDAKVKDIYLALQGAGRLDDTTFIFTSDSGVHYGEQRMGGWQTAGKGDPYDCVMRSPCVIRGRGFPAGKIVYEPTILQDITKTICAIHGATATVPQDGIDLRNPIPVDRDTRWEHTTAVADLPPGEARITTTRKLIRWPSYVGTADEWEMYLLDTDPNEHVNVANDPDYLVERQALEELF